MQLGFSAICREQDVEFHRFGRSSGNRLPLVTLYQTHDYTAILMGQLYYQRELKAELDSLLSPDLRQPDGSNDATLALAVYCQFGMKGIARLEGDFALVIWDAKESRFIAARDPLGGYPLFWIERNGVVAFSTAMSPLLALLPRRSLNLDYVAEFLMLPSSDVQQLTSDACAFEGVHRVQAGSIASVCIPGGQVEQRSFWSWPERIIEPDTDRLEEMSEQFAILLRHAVRERLRGSGAAHLSGGMDSTSVALIAREWINSGYGEAPLHTLSLIYKRLPGLAQETPYLESVLQQQQDIVTHRVSADELLNFDGFTNPPLHDEPWAGLPWLGTGRALVEAAAEAGAASILTGVGGDQITETPPFHVADLLRNGQLYRAWKEASRWANANTCSVWTILYPFGLANLLPAWTREGMGVFLRRGYASWKSQNEYTIAPWILSDFARRYALRSRAIKHMRRTYSFCQPTQLSVALSTITRRNGDWMRWYMAAPQGMIITHPFLDPRVACFGLGILTRFRGEPGRAKPLLAEAMRGVLPVHIRNRRRKGHFNEPYFLGLSRNLPMLEALIRQAPIDDVGLFNKEVLVQCLHQATLGIANGAPALSRLNLTLSFITWFSLQSKERWTVERPTEIVRAHRRTRLTDRRRTVQEALDGICA